MTKKEIQLLYEYDAWADQKTLECLALLTPEQYTKDLDSSFNGIQGTLVHILSANIVWLDRWEGRTATYLKADDFPTVEVVKRQWDKYHHTIQNFVQSLTEKKLNSKFQYTDFKGHVNKFFLAEQMQHKVNHSTYHRGQIVTMLRQLRLQPVSTDFIYFLRQRDTVGRI